VIARRVLLDALEALGEHRDPTILVGAQAIYLHTGDASKRRIRRAVPASTQATSPVVSGSSSRIGCSGHRGPGRAETW